MFTAMEGLVGHFYRVPTAAEKSWEKLLSWKVLKFEEKKEGS